MPQVPQAQLEQQVRLVLQVQQAQQEPKVQQEQLAQLALLVQLVRLVRLVQQAQQALAFWLVLAHKLAITPLQSATLMSWSQSMRPLPSQFRLLCMLPTTKSTYNKLVLASLHLHKVQELQLPQLVQQRRLQKQELNIQLVL
jgi:hypothetical protein